MVYLTEVDRFGSPPSDSLVIKETLNGSSSNAANQFQSVVFLAAEETAEKEEEFERKLNLGGGYLNMEDSLDRIIPNVVGPGFANLGNTCFLNAVLQCVTRTVPLIQGLQSVGHAKPCESYNRGFCLMCTLLYHIDDAVDAEGRVVSPFKLVKNLSYISTDFDKYQQEDAHEFLQCFLDRLETCVSSPDGPSDENSIVKQVYGGSLVSRIQCCECGHYSDTYEPMIDLSIEIGNTDNLLDALESFTDIEPIDADDTKFTCEHCKQIVSIEKQLELESAPSIASFHLKRFKNDGSYVDKIDKHVEFPLELDLSPYTRNPDDVELKYYLYAIVVHEGASFSSGHYYSFVRFSQDEWYKMDDSRVTRVAEEVVLAEEAYILFYAKMGTPWFSSFIMSEKQSIVTDTSNTSPKSVLEGVDHACSSFSGIPVNNKMTEDTRCDNIEVPEAKADDIQKADVTFSFGGGNGRPTPNKIVEIIPSSPSVLKESTFKFNSSEFEATLKEKEKEKISTPVRPSSPDIYAEEESPARKIESSKRKLEHNQEEDSSEMKQARRVVKRMPNQRAKKLLEVLNNSGKKKSTPGMNRGLENEVYGEPYQSQTYNQTYNQPYQSQTYSDVYSEFMSTYNEPYQSQTSGDAYSEFMSTYNQPVEFYELETEDHYKKATRTKNFSPEEDLVLVSAWLNTSIDPIHETYQTSSQYWRKVGVYYKEAIDNTKYGPRTDKSLANRWSTIRFAACGGYYT